MQNYSIAFIDSTVADCQTLAQGIQPGTEVYILDSQRDGIDQITEILRDRTFHNAELSSHPGFSSLHIVSHGTPGQIAFASSHLNAENLETYTQQLQQWAQALTPNASLLLYGCEVAATEAGEAFLKRLSQLTEAEVAASRNLTGSEALGADWKLEFATGPIQAALVFQEEVLATYSHVLATINVTVINDEDDGVASLGNLADISLREAIRYSGVGDTILLPAGTYTLTLVGTNEDLGATGDLDVNRNLTLIGAGTATTVINTAAGWNDRVFHLPDTAAFNLSNVTLSGGNVAAQGGAIFVNNNNVLNLENSTISNNIAYSGAAIFNAGGGDVKITSSTLSNNQVNNINGFGGGAIRNQGTMSISNSSITNNSVIAQGGGGIYSEGQLTIVGSTFSGNQALDPAWGGGAIYAAGTLNLTNSTLSGNGALEKGGGIWWTGNTATLINNTITNNTADSDTSNGLNDQGGGIFSSTPNITLRNTIVAGNFDNSPAAGTVHPDVSGSIIGNGNNLIGNITGNTGTLGTGSDIINATPGLATLTNNGGLTATHALLPGSPAFNAGNNTGVPTTDQRGTGFPRIGNVIVDIGAYEYPDILVNFGAANFAGIEGTAATPITIPISLNITPLANVTVPIVVNAASTATPGADYTFTPTTLTFNAGATGTALTQNLTVTINPDDLPENAETVVFDLGAITNAIAGTTPQTTLSIEANDPITYAIAATPTTLAEGNTGTQPITFTITRSGGIGVASSVNYAIAGTASNGTDYNNIGGTGGSTGLTGTLAFAANETTKTITVDALGDTAIEPDETITVTLSNPNLTAPPESSTIVAGQATAIATLTNDDSSSLSINDVSVTEGNTGTVNASFTVTLAQPSNVPVSVTYAVANNTAEAGTDYVAIPATVLTFAPNETTQTVTVAVNGDNITEANETFFVNLSNPTNATLAKGQGIGTITNDDTAGFNISAIAGNTTEAGGIATFTVQLSSQPTADVTLGLSSSNEAEGTVSPGTLTFTPLNWNQAQTVTVKGVDDTVVDGNVTYQIITAAGVSLDPNYNNLNPTDVTVINQDNDSLTTPTSTPNPTQTPTPTPNPTQTPTPTPNPTQTPTPTPNPTQTPTSTPNPTQTPTPTPNPTQTPTPTPTQTPTSTPTSTQTPTPIPSSTPTPQTTATPTPTAQLVLNSTLVPNPQDLDCFCEDVTLPDLRTLPGPNTIEIVLEGDEDNNAIVGDSLNEAIDGLEGDDILVGRQGNDNMYGGLNSSIPVGSAADEDIMFASKGNDYANGNAGSDIVLAGLGDDIVYGGKDDDLVWGEAGNDTLVGGDGNDTLVGGTPNASILDETGADLLFGLGGNDFLNGEEGRDTLSGGEGNDTLRGGKDSDLLFGDAGDDLLFGDRGNDSLCAGDGEDTLYGDISNPNVVGDGNGKDFLCGGLGNDLLFGNEDQDWLNGEDGNDTLYGGKNGDTLIGGLGNDLLIGDEGNDTLIGGSDNDIFVLTPGRGEDTILDFQKGLDVFGLINELTFSQLSITQSNNVTVIRLATTGEILTSLVNVPANLITAFDFVVV